MGISPRDAADLEKGQSRVREHFVREHLGVNGAERDLYDVVFSNERHSVAEVAAAIFGYVKCGWKGEGYRG